MKSLCVPVSRIQTSHTRVALFHSSQFKSQQGKDLPYNVEAMCADEVKRLDYPHFYSTLFLSRPQRRAVLSLRAFNIETAVVKDVVSSSEIGKVRLQWWKNVIQNIENQQVQGNHLIEALQQTFAEYKLTKTFLIRLLNARIKDVEVSQPRTLDEVEEYCENTASSLLYLTSEILNVRDKEADHAASHLGKAIGLVTLLRGLPYQVQKKHIYLPLELTMQNNVSQEKIFRREHSKELEEVVFQVANRASNHLEWARQLKNKIPKEGTPALLSAGFYDDFLARLQKCNFNPFDESLQQQTLKPRIVVAKNYYMGTF